MSCTKVCFAALGIRNQLGENPFTAHKGDSSLIDVPLFPHSIPDSISPRQRTHHHPSAPSRAWSNFPAAHPPCQISDAGGTSAYYAVCRWVPHPRQGASPASPRPLARPPVPTGIEGGCGGGGALHLGSEACPMPPRDRRCIRDTRARAMAAVRGREGRVGSLDVFSSCRGGILGLVWSSCKWKAGRVPLGIETHAVSTETAFRPTPSRPVRKPANCFFFLLGRYPRQARVTLALAKNFMTSFRRCLFEAGVVCPISDLCADDRQRC
ncbi:hypothetical protein B0T18DRAFT_137024 [Schizothecium vesticola]|uniref:Uncharacterized protein n=1 Tax=Schizothecium vesticola TaxID=314040 RepID=A0AA40K4X4_9PEZI|nr:hypothetical protein B0T18DRAFT_137024 [Schizothecium vesticola]